MKIVIDNFSGIRTIDCNDEIFVGEVAISDIDDATVEFNGKNCLKVWVDDQIIYIYPKSSKYNKYKGGTKTTVVFMDKVISGE